MPLGHKLAVLQERYRREERNEVWRIYVAGAVRALGAERDYLEVLEQYEYARKPENEKQQEIEAAKSAAFSVLERIEKARGGGRE